MGICQYLVTPAEVAEYLSWRERVLKSSDAASVSEAALLGQYMLDDASSPAERFAQALVGLRNDVSGFDLSFILANLADHVDSASKADLGTQYYPLMKLLARMTRSELRLLKERLKYALTAVTDDRVELPARFVSPKLKCGVVVVPVAGAHFANRQVALRNFSILAKYEYQTDMQIGIAVAKQGGDVIIDWYYLESPWSHDREIEEALRDRYPFRPASAGTLPRYEFDSEILRRGGLVGSKT